MFSKLGLFWPSQKEPIFGIFKKGPFWFFFSQKIISAYRHRQNGPILGLFSQKELILGLFRSLKNPLIVVPYDEIKMVMIQLRSILMICKQNHSFKGKQGTSLNVLKGKQKHQTIKVLWAGCTYNELYYVGGLHAEYSSS